VTEARGACGWFRLSAVHASNSAHHYGRALPGIALTKLDVLDGLPRAEISTGYRSMAKS